MTKLEQARKLIAEAPPGPYEVNSDGWLLSTVTDRGVGEIFSSRPAALIVAAVNQYSALLDVVEAAKDYTSPMCYCFDDACTCYVGPAWKETLDMRKRHLLTAIARWEELA